MPYSYPDNIPATVKNLPTGAQKLFIRVFNTVFNDTKDDNRARMAAWHIVKLKYKKSGATWDRKESMSLDIGEKI